MNAFSAVDESPVARADLRFSFPSLWRSPLPIRTRWLIVAGAAVVLVLVYVAFVLGTAVDGHINVDARVHSTILTAFSVTLVSSLVLAGVAHMMGRRERTVQAEFATAQRQREGLEEMLHRIEGQLGGQSLAAALKVPTGEFRTLGADVLPSPGTVAAMRRLADKVTRVD